MGNDGAIFAALPGAGSGVEAKAGFLLKGAVAGDAAFLEDRLNSVDVIDRGGCGDGVGSRDATREGKGESVSEGDGSQKGHAGWDDWRVMGTETGAGRNGGNRANRSMGESEGRLGA